MSRKKPQPETPLTPRRLAERNVDLARSLRDSQVFDLESGLQDIRARLQDASAQITRITQSTMGLPEQVQNVQKVVLWIVPQCDLHLLTRGLNDLADFEAALVQAEADLRALELTDPDTE